MDIWLLDSEFKKLAVIDSFLSFSWADRYFQCGEFSLTVLSSAINVYGTTSVGVGNDVTYVKIETTDRLMVAEKVEISYDDTQGYVTEISGRSLESILARRIVWGNWSFSGKLHAGIKQLITQNIISPEMTTRAIPNFIFQDSTDSTITDIDLDAQYCGENLHDIIASLCQEHKIGFKLILNSSNQLVFSLFKGRETNVIFSERMNNLKSFNVISNFETYTNVAMVMGKEKDDGTKDIVKAFKGTESSGLNRYETYVDGSEVEYEIDGTEIPQATVTEQLKQKGLEVLTKDSEFEASEATLFPDYQFKYGTDYFVGDKVEVRMYDTDGGRYYGRVLEVIISQDSSGAKILPTLGLFDEDEEE